MKQKPTKAQSEYYEKLKDPRWQKLRLQVFERDEWTCQDCKTKENMLTVHHKWYGTDMEPWDYPFDALITLCQSCHNEEREAINWSVYQATHMLKVIGFTANDFLSLSHAIGVGRYYHNEPITVNPADLIVAVQHIIKNPNVLSKLVQNERKGRRGFEQFRRERKRAEKE